MNSYLRGEVWLANFNPAIGSEIRKTRPAVIISDPNIGRLPQRIVVPITEWDAHYAAYPWFVRIVPSKASGLSKESGADAFAVKSISVKRFVRRLGRLNDRDLEEIAAAIALCVGFSMSPP